MVKEIFISLGIALSITILLGVAIVVLMALISLAITYLGFFGPLIIIFPVICGIITWSVFTSRKYSKEKWY